MNATSASQKKSRMGRSAPLLIAVVVTALVTLGLTALLINILQHKQEAKDTYARVVDLDENTVDPAVWGKNFPTQYDMYLRTADQGKTQYGGSEALPLPPGQQTEDHKSQTGSKIEADPRLVQMWAGYAFATDYREKRGHAYMLVDQRETRRVKEFKQPGTCLNCHASMVKTYKDLGGGDTMAGFKKLGTMTYADAAKHAEHPVACIDCHDPKTMELRVTRPAFIEGMKSLKASQGVKDYDVNRDATDQEMRAFVCGQCHVEYYFKGKDKVLTFPWAKGLNLDQEYAYYQENGFVDWTHKTTGAPMLKAQHPEFEIWNQGVHAKAGVTCADCHMPYTRKGAQKVSDHQVRSPMLNVNTSCGTCHKADEKEMKERVATIQSRFISGRDTAFDALTQLIKDIEAAQKSGAPAENVKAAQSWQRKASFYIDYVLSENSHGFHAPQETMRYLNEATDATRKGELALQGKEKAAPGSDKVWAYAKEKAAAEAKAAAAAKAGATSVPTNPAAVQPCATAGTGSH